MTHSGEDGLDKRGRKRGESAITDKEHGVTMSLWEHSTSAPSSQKPKTPPKYGGKTSDRPKLRDFLQNTRPALLQRVKAIKKKKKQGKIEELSHIRGAQREMTARCSMYPREILSQKRDFREKPNKIGTNCDV